MRRSVAVKLTLLPMLATAAVASAQPARAPAAVLDALPPTFSTALAPPGMTEPVLAPPGMTPKLDCAEDPDWDPRVDCTVTAGVIRGGFGHYFWIGGG